MSATRENPVGRRGGRFNSEQYIINDRKILNTLALQKIEDGIVSGRIPTIETHRVAVGIDNGNPPSPEQNPSRGEQTHRVASVNPSPDGEEEVIEEIIEEIKEEKRARRPGVAFSFSRSFQSKPKAAGRDKTEAMALVNEIKKVALDASDGKAVFYAKNSQAIEDALIDNPALARDALLSAVRTRVQDMGGRIQIGSLR